MHIQLLSDFLILFLFSASGCSCRAIVGETGQNITLPCKYNIKTHGALSVCWNRGEIPSQGCDNKLVSTDGVRVNEETRISSRYQLLGKLEQGDISLTILNITEADAGRYGCRVRRPGPFNDVKHHFDLSTVLIDINSHKPTLLTIWQRKCFVFSVRLTNCSSYNYSLIHKDETVNKLPDTKLAEKQNQSKKKSVLLSAGSPSIVEIVETDFIHLQYTKVKLLKNIQ
uniref:Ig-like domain-containing protein n=1 Tax=Salarias fasciatus TaxID=181472 RepID=A0A672FUS5_SALFA